MTSATGDFLSKPKYDGGDHRIICAISNLTDWNDSVEKCIDLFICVTQIV